MERVPQGLQVKVKWYAGCWSRGRFAKGSMVAEVEEVSDEDGDWDCEAAIVAS